jgi:hypothetical protein
MCWLGVQDLSWTSKINLADSDEKFLLKKLTQMNEDLTMTVEDIKQAITHMSPEEFISFRSWYDEFKAKIWNKLTEKKVAEIPPLVGTSLEKSIEPKPVYITGETTLYGIVKRVGGNTPTVLIQTLDGNHISCQVDEILARKLGKSLYTKVGLIGIAKWNVADSAIKAFKIKKMTAYQETPLSEAFSRLSDEIGHDYNDIDAVSWVSTIRGYSKSLVYL